MSDDILLRLMAVLQSRKDADPDSSYVAGLYARGLDTILKKIGEESRISIEGFLEKKVFLELWVKVRQGWSDDKRALASLGYD